jgi:hypothetical protein
LSDTRTSKKEAFLAALAEGDSIVGACKVAEIGRSTAYEWRELDQTFHLGWEQALEASTEKLEREGFRRAIDGSDTLLIFLLKARRPQIYRERYDGPGPKPRRKLSLDHLNEEELASLEQILRKLEASEAS